MKRLILLLLLPLFLNAASVERNLEAIFLGRFPDFITWPNPDKETFTITIIDENPFNNLLYDLYGEKKIKGKKVTIKYIQYLNELEETDILFITPSKLKNLPAILVHAHDNSMLTISDIRGFAQRGGIIQLYIVLQKIRLKINHDASLRASLKISSPLLSISEIVKDGDAK